MRMGLIKGKKQINRSLIKKEYAYGREKMNVEREKMNDKSII